MNLDERHQREIWESRCPALLAERDELLAEAQRLREELARCDATAGEEHTRRVQAERALELIAENEFIPWAAKVVANATLAAREGV